jgi:MoaA/NifB/PqqE/SkfB family radical SAM enzyme
VKRLALRDVQQICESIPVRSMNLGVGENGLHGEYAPILDYLWGRGLRTSITSNGLSIQTLDDVSVKRFHSVEFSLDFPSESEHDAFRGAGNWRTVIGGLGRCVGLGVPVTVTAVMMSINYDRLAVPFSFPETLRMVRTGEIVDSMTIIAVLHAAQRTR